MGNWKGLVGAVLLGLGTLASAQTAAPKPYLTGATLYISVDDWADIWLNGIPIVDGQRKTLEGKGFQTIQCIPAHLCYFRQENTLAILNSDAYSGSPSRDDQVGLAYSFHLRFSDGSQMVLTSNELLEHRSFYLPDREENAPPGWRRSEFDASTWSSAQSEGSHIPGLADLTDPETGHPIGFLTTRPGQEPVPGERHFYRRQFFLDIGPSPYCPPETKAEFWKEPSKKREGRGPMMVPTKPEVIPVVVKKVELFPTATPSIRQADRSVSDPYEPLREFMAMATFTPTIEAGSRPAPTDGGQVIVFDRPPANIYVTFADGPGLYRLDVMDANSVLIKRLFEKKVIADHGEWAVWDGKDSAGMDSPKGDYWVFLSKEGKMISRTLIRKAGTP